MPKKKSEDPQLENPVKFYKDTITLRFSQRDHVYYLVGKDGALEPLEGVTRVCGIIDKSNYLIPWGCKVMAEKLLATTPQENDESGAFIALAWPQFCELVEASKSAHREHLVDAGDVGSAAHAWIEDNIRYALKHDKGVVLEMRGPEPTDERARNCGMEAFKWMKAHNVRWVCTEHKVLSLKHKYAGTEDGKAYVDACDSPLCCGRFPLFMNQLAVIDWKTSNQLRTEYLYQTSAYLAADLEEFPDTKIEARWILRLGKEEGDFEAWYAQNQEEDFAAFLSCLTLRRIHASVEKRISEMKKERTQIKKRMKVKDEVKS